VKKMSNKSRPLPSIPDQNQQISQDQNQSPVDNNTSEYTPDKFYNDNGLSRTSERRDQPQRRRSSQLNRSRQYQQYTQYAPNNQSTQDSNRSNPQSQNFDEQDGQIINNTEDENDDEFDEENSDFFQTAFRPTTSHNHTDFLERSRARISVVSETEISEKRQPIDLSIPPNQRNQKGRRESNSRDNNRPRPPDSIIPPGPDTNPPTVQTRRQKSLVRPERARNNRRAANRQLEEQRNDNNVDGLQRRWSTFSTNHREIDRRKSQGRPSGDNKAFPNPQKKKKCQCPSAWIMFSRCITCWAPPFLVCCGKDKEEQYAWREKVALVVIILTLCLGVGFLTFGFDQVFCGAPPTRIHSGSIAANQISILGRVLSVNTKNFPHPSFPGIPSVPAINSSNFEKVISRSDLTFMFQAANLACKGFFVPITAANSAGDVYNYFPCVPLSNFDPVPPNNTLNPTSIACHGSNAARNSVSSMRYVGDIFYDWDDVQSPDHNYIVYNGQVLDMDRLQWTVPNIQLPDFLNQMKYSATNQYRGRDMTFYLQQNYSNINLAKCMEQTLRVGVVDTISIGCVISSAVMIVSLIFIAGVVLVRFFLAVIFGWILSWRLGSFREETSEEIAKREREIELWSNENNHFYPSSRFSTPNINANTSPPYRRTDSRSRVVTKELNGSRNSRPSSVSINDFNSQSRAESMTSISSAAQSNSPNTPNINNITLNEQQRYNFPLMHTILLVTCYSEGKQGIKTTLDSLARTEYPNTHKLLMCIADGQIIGDSNDHTTPEICVSLMDDFVIPPEDVEPHSYVAIADGKKRHNKAKVYAGYYIYRELDGDMNRVPMITIAKCGGPGEEKEPKAGNRGKRDSQIILMGFLQKVMFNERMTRLEYELFTAIRTVCSITPDFYEVVLMIDADTKVFPDSLIRMVACMSHDASIMGLCGETKISNKNDTWVTRIQVFEYYINHHLQKAFESIFGGVTCLPGCFCMYRIKAPKGENGYWVPILANPDIVEQYSENIVDTLHKKNLLLLGEDRYLTTLMLKNFPKRKTLFVPQSVCKTVVPDTFHVLRSQRRRWINSTVHNLLELVLIPDLCGTFCFSMQFVIFMELVGTVVLPAAISFTMYLVVISFFQKPAPIVPLLLLAAVLGLPAILILVTTRKVIYVGWMMIYLLSLPIWNFVLPSYAFWHFDDFSWGKTRLVKGEEGGRDHSRKEGEFDSSHITMRRWAEWERYRLRRNSQQHIQSVNLSPEENFIPSTRPSSASTMYGSEKSEHIPVSPFNNNARNIRKKTDSLMVPPPLSDSSPVSTTPNEGYIPSPSDHNSQMSQPIYTRSNTNSTNYSNSPHTGMVGTLYSSGYEENNHISQRKEF
ncbi:6235_t:CDS:2, partial [Scutellospora calospora]